MTASEAREQSIIYQIIKETRHWNIDMWFDFRNVFFPDYYLDKNRVSKSVFNEWKITAIRQYNNLLEKY